MELITNSDGVSERTAISPRWSRELLESYGSVLELAAAGLITPAEAVSLEGVGDRFRVRIPRYYAGLFDNTVEGRAT